MVISKYSRLPRMHGAFLVVATSIWFSGGKPLGSKGVKISYQVLFILVIDFMKRFYYRCLIDCFSGPLGWSRWKTNYHTWEVLGIKDKSL